MLFLLALSASIAAFLPDSLLKYPYVTELYEQTVFVKPKGAYTHIQQWRIRVNTAKGLDAAKFSDSYDKNSKIKKFQVEYKDLNGKRIKLFKLSDAYDQSMISASELFSDNRMKSVSFEPNVFPFLCEATIETEHAESMWLPSMFLMAGGDGFLQKEVLRVFPADTTLYRYHLRNTTRKPTVQAFSKQQALTWEINNLRPVSSIPYSPPFNEHAPRVILVPKTFVMDGFAGSWESWKQFGVWYNTINAGRDVLPPDEVGRVQQLVASAGSIHEKIQLLYADLRSSTRYLALNLGIGGFQTIPAAEVCRTKYGDCKGLSNYMKAMLNAAGIPSCYVVVTRREEQDDIHPELPFNQFNHLILAVPTPVDTVWLECTSQTYPAGYLDASTKGRHALMITPEGGRMVRTPEFQADENRLDRKADISLNANGSLMATVIEKSTGYQHEAPRELATVKDAKLWERYVRNQLPDGAITVSGIQFSAETERPEAAARYNLRSSSMVSKAGKMLILRTSLFDPVTFVPDADSTRTLPVRFRQCFTDTDTVRVTPPAGFQVQSLPKDITFEGPGATYSRSVQALPDGTVRITRLWKRYNRRLEASGFTPYREFLKNVTAAEKEAVVFKAQ